MNQSIGNLSANLAIHFDKAMQRCEVINGQIVMTVSAEELIRVCTALRDKEIFAFAQLMDLSGVDYSTYGEADWQTKNASNTGFSRAVASVPDASDFDSVEDRTSVHDQFAVVYQLLSIKHNQRLRVRCFVSGEPPVIPSVVNIWNSADWYEREAFDLFGILFEGHTDLRRILTDYGFIGHPFRKDFPLEGNVEVRYDEEKGRVIYQPVTIENRVLVPRVIRDDFEEDPSEQNIVVKGNEGGHA